MTSDRLDESLVNYGNVVMVEVSDRTALDWRYAFGLVSILFSTPIPRKIRLIASAAAAASVAVVARY